MDIIEQRNLRGGKASPLIKGGYGKDDYYKHYRKNGGTLDKALFSRIIRECNLAVVEELLENAESFVLPYGIGTIAFRKRKNKAFITKDGIRTNSLVDWKSTMALWQDNAQAKRTKVLVKYSNLKTGRYSFRIRMFGRTFKNKSFFAFRFKRSFKRGLATRINTYNKPKLEAEITKTI